MSSTRIERDTMGEMDVPEEALYGASTQRAVLNFPISGESSNPGLIHAYGLIKWAAARVNGELGHVNKDLTIQIERAAEVNLTIISRSMFTKPDQELQQT